jgi:hypothetical protein
VYPREMFDRLLTFFLSSCVSSFVQLQSRLSAQSTLSHFLPSRPQPADLAKSALTLTSEQLEARKMERSARKSVIAQHLQTRQATTTAAATHTR